VADALVHELARYLRAGVTKLPKSDLMAKHGVSRFTFEHARARAEALATSPTIAVEGPPSLAEGISTPPANHPAFQVESAPASGPARAPEREGTSNLTRALEGETSRRVQRVVIASDFHLPHEDILLVQKWIAWLETQTISHLILNGDVLDFEKISRWPSSSTFTTKDTIARGNAFLDQVVPAARARNPHARITWVDGNHCHRLTKYLQSNAGELVGLTNGSGEEVVSIPHLLDLRGRGVSYRTYQQIVRLPGNLYVEHGDRVSKNSASTAMNIVRDKGASVIVGHVHRVGAYYKKDRLGLHRGIEGGCMCDLSPSYMTEDSANWQQGFVIVDYTGESTWWAQQVLVQDGVFVVDGRVW
jgi:predicted phosphodiesterase